MLGVVNEVTPDPEVNTAPPLEAAYQSIVSPELGVADMLTVPVEHLAPPVPLGAVGTLFIVKCNVTTLSHPVTFVNVRVGEADDE